MGTRLDGTVLDDDTEEYTQQHRVVNNTLYDSHDSHNQIDSYSQNQLKSNPHNDLTRPGHEARRIFESFPEQQAPMYVDKPEVMVRFQHGALGYRFGPPIYARASHTKVPCVLLPSYLSNGEELDR